jgi:hypothetical protein
MKTRTVVLASIIALGATMAQAQSGVPGGRSAGGNVVKGDRATGAQIGTTGNGTTATGNPGGRTTSGMVNQRGVRGHLEGRGTRSLTVR